MEHKPLRYHAKIQQDLITTTRSRSRRSPGVGLLLVESLTCTTKQNPKTTRQIHCGTRFSFPHRKHKKEGKLSCNVHAACSVELLLVQLFLLAERAAARHKLCVLFTQKQFFSNWVNSDVEFTFNCRYPFPKCTCIFSSICKTNKTRHKNMRQLPEIKHAVWFETCWLLLTTSTCKQR